MIPAAVDEYKFWYRFTARAQLEKRRVFESGFYPALLGQQRQSLENAFPTFSEHVEAAVARQGSDAGRQFLEAEVSYFELPDIILTVQTICQRDASRAAAKQYFSRSAMGAVALCGIGMAASLSFVLLVGKIALVAALIYGAVSYEKHRLDASRAVEDYRRIEQRVLNAAAALRYWGKGFEDPSQPSQFFADLEHIELFLSSVLVYPPNPGG